MNGLSVMPCVQQVQAVSGRSYRECSYRGCSYRGYAAGTVSYPAAEPGSGKLIRISGSRGSSSSSAHLNRAADRQTSDRDLRARSGAAGDSSKRTGRTVSGTTVPALIRILVLAVLFAVMIAGFQTMTGASSRREEKKYKYYTTITLGYGEDITDVVYKYCDSSKYSSPEAYVREICEINSLPCRRGDLPELSAGSKIVIPYYDTEIK